MKKPSVGLALEGVPFICLSIVTTLTLALNEWEMAALAMLVVTGLVFNFFRDPERVAPSDESLAVAPADGKVVKVGRAVDPITGRERNVVCIFMNLFNVHVNRMPVSCMVRRIEYIPGKFFNASLDKASEDNERCLVHAEDSDGEEWTTVQIAGLVARRIVCWTEPGDFLSRGQRFGLIKFGSRVDLYMPDGYAPVVAVGDKVHAGETPVAAKK
jgi:phosphatidylserine decarboxylase